MRHGENTINRHATSSGYCLQNFRAYGLWQRLARYAVGHRAYPRWVATGAEIRTFTGHTHEVTSVGFSPDGTQVLTGSWDGTARLWWATNPPPESITRCGPSPTDAGVLEFNVTFSVPVTGVDVSDFALATTGAIISADIAGVTGSGSVYTVTVENVEGDGTLRLDLIDDDSIVDAGGNPLGGPGAGNGDFTAGEAYVIVPQLPVAAWATVTALLVAGVFAVGSVNRRRTAGRDS